MERSESKERWRFQEYCPGLSGTFHSRQQGCAIDAHACRSSLRTAHPSLAFRECPHDLFPLLPTELVGKRGFHASGTCERKRKTSCAAKLPKDCQAVGSPTLAPECFPCIPAFQDLSWILKFTSIMRAPA